MAGSIINDLKREKLACEREFDYWKKQADAMNAEADSEEDSVKAMALREEATRCEHFAEEALSFLEHLKAACKSAEEVL